MLLAGETWLSYGIHQKGFSAYTTGGYEVGSDEFVAALETQGWAVEHIPNHLATEQFPRSLDELAGYDVVILSDIGADTLLLHPDSFVHGRRTPNRLRLLSDWVEGGGGFLMVGGYMSFSGFEGKASYNGSQLERCLPVTMLGFDDRVEAPEGVHPTPAAPEHPILSGLAAEWPYLLGYNRVDPKASGEVVLSVDGDPLLVVGEHGYGRSAAFTSDCSPHWGSPEFMAWPSYAAFWGQLLGWLAAGSGER